MNFSTRALLRAVERVLWVVLAGGWPAFAQSPSVPASPATQAELDAKVRMLSQSLEETRVELSESRSEIRQLRAVLERVLSKMGDPDTPTLGVAARREQTTEESAGDFQTAKSNGEQHLARITEEDWQIVNARLEEFQQDKVESSSKYRLKLSGIGLFNAFGQTGHVDNLDVPAAAFPRPPGTASGSLGASLRQSIVGLTGVGPDLYGARMSGDVQMDFFGGLPSGYGAATSGVMRLRTARIRFDWENTSVVVGLDAPFFSPNTPTSYMSLAVPGFASAGNLWTWAPTIRVEQRWATPVSQFKIEAGVLDAFGGVPYVLVQPSDLNQYNTVTAPALAGIRMLGGWSQLKVKLNERSDFNLAGGSGARSARGTRQIALLDPTLQFLSHRNDMWFANYIFRPRSNLVLSTEYRRLRTYEVSGAPAIAGQVGLAVGFIF